jgi:hypothetical protein
MPDRPSFPIPEVINPPRKCLCIEIPWTDDHKQVIAGLLWELTQWFNWQRDDEQSGAQLAAVYRDVFLSIDWSDMSCCCGEQPNVLRRVNPEDPSKTQISSDGGATWTDDPLNPSIGGSTLPAPIPSGVSATKCDAASNGKQHVQDFVARVQELITTGGVVWDALAALAIFLVGLFLLDPAAIPAIVPVLIGLFSIVFALTGTVWTDYFTSDVYDIIVCALFCHMEDDGTFTDADATAVFADLESHLPAGVQKDFLLLVLRNQGTKGLNNMCAYGASAEADCSACACGDCPAFHVTAGVLLDQGKTGDLCWARVRSVDHTSHFAIEIAFNAAGTHPSATDCVLYDHVTKISGVGTTVPIYYQACNLSGSYLAISTGVCMSYFDLEDYSGGTGSECVYDVFWMPTC